MDYLFLLLCLYISWGLLQAVRFAVKPRSERNPKPPLPPGPRPLPVIGNLLELGNLPYKSLAELAKIHGPIMTLRLGFVTTVIISSASVAREVFQSHDLPLSARTLPESVTPYQHDRLSLAWMPISPLWKTIRRILTSHMFSNKNLDSARDLRHQKVRDLVAQVGHSVREGKSVALYEEASRTALNFLSYSMFSVDFAGSDGVNNEFGELIHKIMVQFGKPNLADYFPILKWIDPNGVRREMAKYFKEMLGVFDSLISKRLHLRRESINSARRNPDLLDSLLDICENKTEEIDIHIVKLLFLDLFTAGTDTTSSTLEWAMAELLRNPDKLSKARAELEQEIGKGNQVQESDIAKLPYLQAIVKETFRVHPIVPLLLPRKAEADTVVQGFRIPKGTQVLVNTWAIARDPTTWDEPDMFLPERFLGSKVDVKGQDFELIPFGAGRRICPGMPLAMRMLQLMLGSLINCFEWRLEDDMKPEDINMEEKYSITIRMGQPLRAIPVSNLYVK